MAATTTITEHGERHITITDDGDVEIEVVEIANSEGILHASYGPAFVAIDQDGVTEPAWEVIYTGELDCAGRGSVTWMADGRPYCKIERNPFHAGWCVTWLDGTGKPVLSVECSPCHPPRIWDPTLSSNAPPACAVTEFPS